MDELRIKLEELAVQARDLATSGQFPGQVNRVWQVPDNVGDASIPSNLLATFDRDDLNELYVDIASNGTAANTGRIGHRMAVKLAIDYLACQERALHARHADGLRCRAWANGRRYGHGGAGSGSAYNGVFGAVLLWLNQLVAMSQSEPNAPDVPEDELN